ncbi:MAG: transcriptional regulator [Synergistaceae bacterium]|nr:PAS domain-containing protein [Synergistaceae bacterium]
MSPKYISLTATDKQILESYKIMIDGMADYMGEGYEIILHSLQNLDRSVIKIINGHYTGREEGAPITDLALSMLSKIAESKEIKSLCYFTKDKAGVTLKSTTIPIVGENDRIIGLLCINFHTEISFSKMLSAFMPTSDNSTQIMENFTDNVDNLISTALEEARNKVLPNPKISAANKNKEIINNLYQKGIFNIKDSVLKISQILNISKNTVYLHIRNLEEKELKQRY